MSSTHRSIAGTTVLEHARTEQRPFGTNMIQDECEGILCTLLQRGAK